MLNTVGLSGASNKPAPVTGECNLSVPADSGGLDQLGNNAGGHERAMSASGPNAKYRRGPKLPAVEGRSDLRPTSRIDASHPKPTSPRKYLLSRGARVSTWAAATVHCQTRPSANSRAPIQAGIARQLSDSQDRFGPGGRQRRKLVSPTPTLTPTGQLDSAKSRLSPPFVRRGIVDAHPLPSQGSDWLPDDFRRRRITDTSRACDDVRFQG